MQSYIAIKTKCQRRKLNDFQLSESASAALFK